METTTHLERRLGVIDLGTNTFHLLIVEATPRAGIIRELYREQRFVKLGQGGLERIGEEPFQRGIQTLCDYRDIISSLQVGDIRAIGTAALRTAANGPAFIDEVAQRCGIRVELISGDREAALIHRGVRAAVPFGDRPYLIMDIGGGSVEFILADARQVFWAQSFPIGLAVLYQQAPGPAPLTPEQGGQLRAWLDRQLAPLFIALDRFPPATLVGAAGTFDVLEKVLAPRASDATWSQFTAGDFQELYRQVLPTSYEERLALDWLPASRADLFVMALVLIDFILQRSGLDSIKVSNYALKEGMLLEMVE